MALYIASGMGHKAVVDDQPAERLAVVRVRRAQAPHRLPGSVLARPRGAGLDAGLRCATEGVGSSRPIRLI